MPCTCHALHRLVLQFALAFAILVAGDLCAAEQGHVGAPVSLRCIL